MSEEIRCDGARRVVRQSNERDTLGRSFERTLGPDAETSQAAKQAGIHPVSLIKEPEAAALYTLRMLQDKALAVSWAGPVNHIV